MERALHGRWIDSGLCKYRAPRKTGIVVLVRVTFEPVTIFVDVFGFDSQC